MSVSVALKASCGKKEEGAFVVWLIYGRRRRVWGQNVSRLQMWIGVVTLEPSEVLDGMG